MRERDYQRGLIKRIKNAFPGCLIMKTDASHDQGIPDLLILFNKAWAALEVKRSAKATHRPNQDDFVDELNAMSFARFIFPENETEVLNELRQYFGERSEARTCPTVTVESELDI